MLQSPRYRWLVVGPVAVDAVSIEFAGFDFASDLLARLWINPDDVTQWMTG